VSGLLAGNLDFGFGEQTSDVSEGSDGGSDKPGQTEERRDSDEKYEHEQVEMVSMRLLLGVENSD
jgi:hypothetical protein